MDDNKLLCQWFSDTDAPSILFVNSWCAHYEPVIDVHTHHSLLVLPSMKEMQRVCCCWSLPVLMMNAWHTVNSSV